MDRVQEQYTAPVYMPVVPLEVPAAATVPRLHPDTALVPAADVAKSLPQGNDSSYLAMCILV